MSLQAYKNQVQLTTINIENQKLNALFHLPHNPIGLVIYVHGSGSSRLSPRNQFVASYLSKHHLATLLFDLLTPEEEEIDTFTGEFRFNIQLLAERLMQVTAWTKKQPNIKDLPIGYFGSSTGAAGAIIAANHYKKEILAVVSRGGRPDMATDSLKTITAPTLLIVGSLDYQVIELNQNAQNQMTNTNKLEIIPGATHLFEEPGTLEKVAQLATQWFSQYFKTT